MSGRALRVEAYAKLTLSLHITGMRADGFHELDAVMVTVSEPRDVLEIEPAGRTSIEVVGPFANGVPLGQTNLVWRALDALGVHASVQIDKQIPSGAGLGGGSADAAAVLRAFDADATIAATLGADVPLCVHGGPARVRGVGEIVEPVDMARKFVVIATPRFGCSTAAVYRAWDTIGAPHADVNDLEPAAFAVEPRLVEFKRAVGEGAILAGSGSSYARVFDDRREAEHERARVAASIDGSVWLGHVTSLADDALT
jgi:4-diphosphocytidyl-2-C-methyl-D-erythritol kinase